MRITSDEQMLKPATISPLQMLFMRNASNKGTRNTPSCGMSCLRASARP